MLNNDSAKAQYKIWDSQKNFYLPSSYKTRRTANHAADRMNIAYGAGRFYVAWLNPAPLDKKMLSAGEKSA
jgi:hypothetical protein